MAAPAVARPHRTAAADSVSAVSAGGAVLEAVSKGFTGRVEGVFRDGFYVSGPSETLFAVVSPRCWPGPLHLVVEDLVELPGRHDRVSLAGGMLRAGRLTIRIDGGAPWAPSLPGRLGAGPRAWRGLAACPAFELAAVWEAVACDLRGGHLLAAFRRLQGRGTGLTPSGDDVLAGILLVGAIDPSWRRTLTGLVRRARTTRLSRAFLRWAAAGQSIQPAHALLDAAASGDQLGMRRAAASLAEVGATSGRALAAGIALAATELPDVAAPHGGPPVPVHGADRDQRRNPRPHDGRGRPQDRPVARA